MVKASQRRPIEVDLLYWLRGYMESRAEHEGELSAEEIRELLEKTDPANPNHTLAHLYPFSKELETDNGQ